jgi:hypothetical protein
MEVDPVEACNPKKSAVSIVHLPTRMKYVRARIAEKDEPLMNSSKTHRLWQG